MAASGGERWGSRAGLVLATAGSAVGLGNFLRFPAEAAQNGGGAFLIPYLISFVLMGLPLLWVEWAIGRHGGGFGLHSTPGVLDAMGKAVRPGGVGWLKYLGVFGLFIQISVAAFYCYIESWTLAYVWHSAVGTFRDVPPAEFFPRYLGQTEGSIFALPGEATFWFVLTLALNVWILSRGVAKGVELASKIGMPLLLIFGAILAVRGLTLGVGDPGVVESPLVGLGFVWQPDLSGLTNPTVWLAAAGQIFFTLSVGVGSLACYASYVRKNDDIALNAASAGWMNEFVEVVLGSAILIPIATAYLGLAAVQTATVGGSGFGLGFLTLPTLFANWGWFAPVAGVLWFGLLFLAGITSSLSLGQPLMAFLEDEFQMSRRRAAWSFGTATFALGFVCVWLYPGGAFDEFNFWAGTFALVTFALLEVVAFAWIFGIERGWGEITRGADIAVPRFFRFVIRWVTPPFILVIFLTSLVKPAGAWGAAFASLAAGRGWPFAADSVVGKILHVGAADAGWFDAAGRATPVLVQDATRMLLTLLVLGLVVLVWIAWRRPGGMTR